MSGQWTVKRSSAGDAERAREKMKTSRVRRLAKRFYVATGLETRIGTVDAHRRSKADASTANAATGLTFARARTRLAPCDDAPILIAAPCWRSGSTLVQRLVNSSDRHFIWGEPYAHTHMVERWVESLEAFGNGYPEPNYLWKEGDGIDTLRDDWTANMFPPMKQWFEAQRLWFQTSLASPPEMGARQWGLKTVRFDDTHVRYMRWLFPRMKTIVVLRDPLASYRSYKQWRSWYKRFPSQQIRTAEQFGRMWSTRTASLATMFMEPDVHVVKYEELITSSDPLHALQEFIGSEVDRRALATRVAGISSIPGSLQPAEIRMLNRSTNALRYRLGYVNSRPSTLTLRPFKTASP